MYSKKTIAAIALTLGLGACASTPQELVNTSEHKKTISTNTNYQAVYRNVLSEAKNCLAGAQNLFVSNKVEGQLYGDLGFGEISYYQENLNPIHIAYVKAEKVTDGSKISIYIGGQVSWAAENTLGKFEKWALGSKGC